MKKIVFLLSFFALNSFIYGQTDYIYTMMERFSEPTDSILQYKSLEEFDNDTITYLGYNFIKRIPEAYAGMKVQEFIDLLPFAVCDIGVANGIKGEENSGVNSFSFYIFREEQDNKLDGKRANLSIEVGIEPIISWKDIHIAWTNYNVKDLVINLNPTVTFAKIESWQLQNYWRIIYGRKDVRPED
ncbi:MAG: hypothetical protein LBV43_08080 [Prevotella sp.]|jgi:hypothetical protein|nr:hypothetical protein [Prevotella sp.]